MFKNKKVMLLGGTGYIGSLIYQELLKQEADITILSRDEYKQFCLKERNTGGKVKYVIGDVRDIDSIRPFFENIDYVFDFAAMKHVLICEENPMQAIETNMLGTNNVAKCAIEAGVKRVIYASSDKAVLPTNTYGATKMLAEKLLYSYQLQNSNTRFMVARFVNILGSRGSVLDKWKYQIDHNQPVTITHPDMIRYFITKDEACEFLLGMCMDEGDGTLFVPQYHKIKINDLCDVFIDYICDKYGSEKERINTIVSDMCEVEKIEEDIFNDYELNKHVDVTDKRFSINVNAVFSSDGISVPQKEPEGKEMIYKLLERVNY